MNGVKVSPRGNTRTRVYRAIPIPTHTDVQVYLNLVNTIGDMSSSRAYRRPNSKFLFNNGFSKFSCHLAPTL